MARLHLLVSTVLLGALVPGCVSNNSDNDTQGGPTSTTSTTSGTDGTAGDSAPTTTMTAPDTTDGTTSTSGTCSSGCDDMPVEPVECDNWAQDCPEGQKCAAYILGDGGAWNALKCVEVTGTDGLGEPCTTEGAVSGIDSCIEGAMCWGYDKDGVGTCVALCAGSPEAPVCGAYSVCTLANEGVLNLCEPFCDPVLQDCYADADACHVLEDGTFCGPYGIEEKALLNEPCTFLTDCDKGLLCSEAAFVGMVCPEGATGCCTPYCAFPDGACPNPDQECIQYLDPMTVPADHPLLNIGVCGVPL